MEARVQAVAPTSDDIADLIAEGRHRQAVARCARLHGPSIGRLCMALLGSQDEADEVAQETLLAAHRAMGTYRGEGSVRSWLFGIARRQCARWIERRRGKRPQLEVVGADAETDGPAELLTARRRAVALRRALGRLKPSEREALVLRYQAGLSFREIGDACGVAEAAARKRASRGLSRLRELVRPEDLE
jgi:RNA polymerase sigma-70 factor, ECF subfamily